MFEVSLTMCCVVLKISALQILTFDDVEEEWKIFSSRKREIKRSMTTKKKLKNIVEKKKVC